MPPLSACGIVANHKPIQPGTPTASIHFGSVRDGFVSQSVQVHDGEMCHPGEFARFHAIGAYLGSDLDVEVPANQMLFVQMGNAENHGCAGGLCTTRCDGGISFSPKPDAKYTARIVYQDKKCAIVVNVIENGTAVPVATHPET